MKNFEKEIHKMFDSIWDYEIEHPVFQETVGDLMDVVIKIYKECEPERRTGKWIKADECGDITSWECSCCHRWTGLPTGWNVKAKLLLCPKCGAKMKGE